MKISVFVLNLVIGLLTALGFGVGFVTIVSEGYRGEVIPQDLYEATALLLIVSALTLFNAYYLYEE